MSKDKMVGIPTKIPIIGGGEQKMSMDEIIQSLMKNIHQLNTDYQSFVQIANELNTRVALLETRASAVEAKQTAFPAKIEVTVKKEK